MTHTGPTQGQESINRTKSGDQRPAPTHDISRRQADVTHTWLTRGQRSTGQGQVESRLDTEVSEKARQPTGSSADRRLNGSWSAGSPLTSGPQGKQTNK